MGATVWMLLFAAGLAANLRAADTTPGAARAWNPQAAAVYLDGRLNWWMSWPVSARDHQTFCISCHTALPYALARPALHRALGEQEPETPAAEQELLENVRKRVRLWAEVAPFYPDEQRGVPKTAESRGTESILNALILVRNERDPAVLGDARRALDNMWAQQLTAGEAKGAWAWLQFHNAPWEGDSQYYGATLAALAVASAPADYRASAQIQPGLQLLTEYLERECGRQVLLNQVMLLWASGKLPQLLSVAGQDRITGEALARQQADGGFSLSALVGDWKRRDGTPLETKSDGLATALVALAFESNARLNHRPELGKALGWLAQNQQAAEGRWLAYSLNKQRDLTSDIGKFMSDAATAYAVLALTEAPIEHGAPVPLNGR